MKNYFSILFLLLPFLSLCQSYSVEGTVTDQKDENLPSATVVLLSQIDSTMSGFALSNNDGRFIITDIDAGSYSLQISYLGFEQYEEKIEVGGTDTKINMEAIKLSPASNQIEEVIVKGETTPIQVNKDTIVYNANAFKTQPNDVVEDLLKQMPGVEIEDDGTIVAQGEKVEKVTVDGKDFFGTDPTIATKNLPAKAVDKVEIFDKKSDRAEFTGIDDGERTKTMNLELKEEYKKGFFGNTEVAGGLETSNKDSKYKVRGNINRFSKKSQISFIGNLNNINEQGFSTEDYFSFMSSMGALGRGPSRQGNSGISINQGLSDGYVDTGAAGINFNYDPTSKTEINLSYFVNDISSIADSRTMRETFINDSNSFFNDDHNSQITDNTNHNINLRIEQKIDSTQDIRLQSSIKLIKGTLSSNEESSIQNEAGILENTGDIDYQSTVDQISPTGSLLYRKKLGKTAPWIVSLEGNLNTANSDSDGTLNSITDLAPSDPTIDLRQMLMQQKIESDDENSYRLDASITQPLGGNQYLDYSYRRSNTSNDVLGDVYDIDNDILSINDELSTAFTRDYVYNRYGLSWQRDGEKSTLSIGANLQQSQLDGDILTLTEPISNSNVAFLPNAFLRYEIDRGNNFSIRYRTNINQPTIEQLQPVVDQSDPLNLYIGNPDLNVEYNHSLRMRYINWDQFNFSSLFAFMTVNYKRNNIIEQTFIDEEFVQTTKPINVSDDLNIRTNISYSRPIRSLGTKVKVFANNTYQNSIQYINLTKNDVNRYNTSLGFTLENRNKDNYTLSGTARWTYNINKYSENSEQNLSYLNHSYKVEARLDAIKNWSFATNMDVRIYSEQDFSPAETIPIWTASVSKYFLSDDKGEFRISAYDLLNQNQSINRTSNVNYIENETINTLGRYLLASFLYRFNSAGSAAKTGGRKKFMITH